MMPEHSSAPAPTPTVTPGHTPANESVATSTDADLIRDAARTVVQVPGILRLDPRLKDIFRRIDPTNLFSPSGSKAPQGVSIVTLGSITDITVDITISFSHQALATAKHAEETLKQLLRNYNREPGRVVINILAIE